jgi:hypothetical protein
MKPLRQSRSSRLRQTFPQRACRKFPGNFPVFAVFGKLSAAITP